MFPPPKPWQQIAKVDPEREYLAFTSRFFLRSPWRLPPFLWRGRRIGQEVSDAAGLVGWSLGIDLRRLEGYTLSAWEDEASLQAFAHDGQHGVALRQFAGDMRRESLYVTYTVKGRDLPLQWADALRRQEEALRGTVLEEGQPHEPNQSPGRSID